MKILVVGTQDQFEECHQKLGEHECVHVTAHSDAESQLSGTELIFDFLTSEKPESISFYAGKSVTAFLNTWKVSLTTLVGKTERPISSKLFGFNGFPTLFNRKVLEVSVMESADQTALSEICAQLKTDHLRVEDRVGLVTPRVICMIINEAYFTVQEGTASKEDIDLAMKLGMHYPHGPFEWCQMIGLKNVYELLQAVYEDTRDERYKISALMKQEFQAQMRIGHL